MRPTFAILIILFLSSGICAEEYNLKKVKILADKYDCTPIWHNPKVGPLIKFWYSDISSITGRPDGFVFMCQLKSDDRVFRIIIATEPDSNIWQGCPLHIDIRNVSPFPSGLAVKTIKDPGYFKLELSEWRNEDGKKGPEEVKPTAPVIDTSDNIAGDIFYCYEREWLRLHVD